MKDIILIGGAEGTGKSTLTKQLAARFGVPWISTDQIRTILQITEPDEAKRQALVWAGLAALVRAPHPWDGAVIEGTAILPEFVKRDLADITYVKPIFLVQEDESKIAQIVLDRSKLPFIKTKTPEQQAAKVQKLTADNRALKETAKTHGYPCIPAHDEKTFELALQLL